MVTRFASALVVSFILVGCAQPQPSQEEIWAAVEGCGGQERCSKASVAVLQLNKQAGRDFGNGVMIREARTDGRVVTLDLNVPTRIKDAPIRDGRTIKQQISDSMRRNLCTGEDMRRFLSLGGEVRLRLFLPSQEIFSEDYLRSC